MKLKKCMVNQGRVFIFISFLFIGLAGHAQQTIVFGSDSAYAGDSLIFYKIRNPVTNFKETLAACKTDTAGGFKISFFLEEITTVYVLTGATLVYFYAGPGNTYELAMVPKSEPAFQDLLNPYYTPSLIHAGIHNAKSADLNSLIQDFDQFFNPFFNIYAKQVYVNIKLEDINRFKVLTDSLFGHVRNRYFQNYIGYRIRLLDYMKLSGATKELAYEMFPAEEPDFSNQAYIDLFNQVYTRSLIHIENLEGCSNFSQLLQQNDPYPGLKSCMKATGLFNNEFFKDMVILKGISEESVSNYYPREGLINLLQGMITDGSESAKEIAGQLLWKMTRLDPGKPAPDFLLINKEGKKISLRDYRGKYLFLGFVSSKSYSSAVQLPLLFNMADTFTEQLSVVTISVEPDIETFRQVLDAKNYPWDFLYYGGTTSVLEAYNVRAFPSFFLIDREGKLVWPFDPGPATGFEERFLKLIESQD